MTPPTNPSLPEPRRPDILPRGLIVSCQALPGEPLHGSSIMAAMARAAAEGGAVGIRANGPADIAAIRAAVDLPIVGLYKLDQPDSPVYITPTRAAAEAVVDAGADVVAVDATMRPRPRGEPLAQLIAFIREELGRPVMADVASVAEAEQAESFGADVVSTTMAGYTENGRPPMEGPDLELLRVLIERLHLPVVAEGRYATPEQVARARILGAHAVVVGGAITRPQLITERFARAWTERDREDGKKEEGNP